MVVTDRGRAIARVLPVGAERVLDRLIAEGVVTPAAAKGQGLRPRRRPAQVISYFETSAVVPLLVVEADSPRAASLWDGADRVSIHLVYPEGRVALAQAYRIGRLTARQLQAAVTQSTPCTRSWISSRSTAKGMTIAGVR